MSAGRRSSRRLAAFILYQADLLRLEGGVGLQRVEGEGGEVGEYARRLVAGVEADRARIDSTIRPHLKGWTLERLGVLERAIMRVATFELLLEGEVPIAVVIDEAVDLAKRFCSDEAAALVNGVLAGVATEARQAGEKREQPVSGT